MSDKQDKDAKPAKGKGMLVKAVLGVVLVAAGGGAVSLCGGAAPGILSWLP